MKPTVAFHADDLGHDGAANRGIESALEAGLVRSVSLRVVGDAVEEGASIARRHVGRIDVGLHFSLTEGSALSGPAEGLTDVLGNFLPLAAVLASATLGVPHARSIRRELRAQMRRARELGLEVDHLDGHHHVHALRGVRNIVAEEVGDLRIRAPREPKSRSLRALVVRAIAGPGPSAFAGVALRGHRRYRDGLASLLARPPAPAFELMVHPRTDHRAELDTLTDRASIRWIEARCHPCRLRDLPA